MSVHNHGPSQGKGLACKESLVDGKLVGECLRDAVVPTLPELEISKRHEPEDWQELLTDVAEEYDAYVLGDVGLRDSATATANDVRFLASQLPALLSRVREQDEKIADMERIIMQGEGLAVKENAALASSPSAKRSLTPRKKP